MTYPGRRLDLPRELCIHAVHDLPTLPITEPRAMLCTP